MQLPLLAISSLAIVLVAPGARASIPTPVPGPSPEDAPVPVPSPAPELPGPPDPPAAPAPAPVSVPAPATAWTTPPAQAAPGRPRMVRHSYGGQIILTDLATIALTGITGGVALIGYPLAPPFVHAFNGNGPGALASLALRLTAPVVGGYVGYQIDTSSGCNGDLCGLGGIVVGGVVGMLTASIVDAAVLARVDRPVEVRALRHLPTPTVAIARDGNLLLGAAGRF